MSRAFTKESDGALDPLPDLPLSPHPNYVTPAGLAALRARLAGLQETLAALRARPDRLDKLPEAAAERDIRYVEARLRSAILVDPAGQPAGVMAFGLAATVEDETGTRRVFAIVGEDEADPARGLIAPHAPLARALIGAVPGDEVDWRRPGGTVRLTIVTIART